MRLRRADSYDLVVLGGGTGGLVSAQVAAAAGARVALVERERTGGDCLWTGCVPSKSLIAAADLAHGVGRAHEYGLEGRLEPVSLERVMDRVQRVIAQIEPDDSPQRLRGLAIDVIEDQGRFTGPHTLSVGARQLRFRSAIVATGAAPVVPPIPGMEGPDVFTSDTFWGLHKLPERLVVLGGGPIGCELGQALGRLGAEVAIVDVADRLLPKDDPEAAATVAEALAAEGITLHLERKAVEVRREESDRGQLAVEGPAGPEQLPFDALLVAVGRRARTKDMGLEALGLQPDERGALAVGDDLRTNVRHVFAVGDVTGRMPFTHVAAHHARIAAVNALFGTRRKVDPVLPWVTFTRPEVAHVGLTLAEARETYGHGLRVARSDLADLDRAVTEGRTTGFSLLVGDPKGRLVGATVVGSAAGEVIAELTARVKHGDKIDAVSTTVHAYPTMAEAPARAADDYLRQKYARPLPRALSWLALGARRLI